MAVISIRFNRNEENVLKFLTSYFDKDKSSVIKEALVEKYEDLQDLKAIKRFEKDEKKGKTTFSSAEDVLKDI